MADKVMTTGGKSPDRIRINDLNELQRKILFSFADAWTEDLNYITSTEYKSYHLHEKIRTHLSISEDYFYIELRNLFKLGFLDLINEEFFFMSNIGENFGLQGINSRLNEITNQQLINGDKDKSCISKYGLLALNTYLLNVNKLTIEKIELFDQVVSKTKEDIEKHEAIINSFNSNILTIMSILITVFSIIGLNIGTIKYFEDILITNIFSYIGTIIVVNISILISIFALFYLLSKLIDKTNNKAFKLSTILSFFAIIATMTIIAIFFFGLEWNFFT